MIAFARTPIDPDETAGELEDRLARLGRPLIAETIAPLARGQGPDHPPGQGEGHTAPKLSKEDGLIDWSRSGAGRSTTWSGPCSPGRWPRRRGTSRGDASKGATRLIVHKTEVVGASVARFRSRPAASSRLRRDRLVVAAGEGDVRILVVQVPGKKPMPAAEFLRGHRVQPGDRDDDRP